MSTIMDDDELLDFADHPKIQADGIAEMFSVNGRTHVVLFRLQAFGGKIRRVAVGEVELPASAKLDFKATNTPTELARPTSKH
jgi:hypothetical protein